MSGLTYTCHTQRSMWEESREWAGAGELPRLCSIRQELPRHSCTLSLQVQKHPLAQPHFPQGSSWITWVSGMGPGHPSRPSASLAAESELRAWCGSQEAGGCLLRISPIGLKDLHGGFVRLQARLTVGHRDELALALPTARRHWTG